MNNNVDQIYNEFWKPIVENKLGFLNKKQVKAELADYYFLLQEVPKVYCEVTGGNLSKLYYPADVIIAEFNDHINDMFIYKDDILDILNDKEVDMAEKLDCIRDLVEE